MARIDWMLACELAYFDRYGRICMVGVTTELLVPSLPLSMRQLMIVTRLADRVAGQPIDIGFAVATPDGQWIGPNNEDDIHVEVGSEYILIRVRDVPFSHEGMYRFGLRVDQSPFLSIDIPVLVLSASSPLECH